jgi:hypothetical protein
MMDDRARTVGKIIGTVLGRMLGAAINFALTWFVLGLFGVDPQARAVVGWVCALFYDRSSRKAD